MKINEDGNESVVTISYIYLAIKIIEAKLIKNLNSDLNDLFSNNDINEFILSLRKCVYPYE